MLSFKNIIIAPQLEKCIVFMLHGPKLAMDRLLRGCWVDLRWALDKSKEILGPTLDMKYNVLNNSLSCVMEKSHFSLHPIGWQRRIPNNCQRITIILRGYVLCY